MFFSIGEKGTQVQSIPQNIRQKEYEYRVTIDKNNPLPEDRFTDE